jgi:antitoxin Phd
MAKRYSIAEARHNFAAIVHELEEQPLIELTRRGEPVAMLVGIEAYRRLQPAGAGFWQAYERFRSEIAAESLVEPLNIFDSVRERSPGREPAL